jgi:hypothetical protein
MVRMTGQHQRSCGGGFSWRTVVNVDESANWNELHAASK